MPEQLGAVVAAGRRRLRLAWCATVANDVIPAAAATAALTAAMAWSLYRPLPAVAVVAVPVAVAVAIAVVASRATFPDLVVARVLERCAGAPDVGFWEDVDPDVLSGAGLARSGRDVDGLFVSAIDVASRVGRGDDEDVERSVDENDWHDVIRARAAAAAGEPGLVRRIPVRFNGRRLGVAAVAIAVGASLSLVTPPWVDRPTAAERRLLEAEADRLQQAAELLDAAAADAEPDDADLAELADRLADLARDIRAADSPELAAERLDRTADEQRREAGHDLLSDKAAVHGLEQQLASSPLASPSNGAAADAAGQFEALAEQLPELTDEQRQQLAEQLQQLAAAQAGGNATVSNLLATAASAISGGDVAAAASALSQAAAAQRAAVADVSRRSVAGAVASAAAASAGNLRNPSSGQGQGAGAGQGQGAGEGQGAGQGAGSGPGQGGTGSGPAGNGGPSGQVAGASPSGNSPSGQGGVGTPGAGTPGDGTTPVDRATVFDPAQAAANAEVQVTMDGGQGTGQVVGRADGQTQQGDALVPYQDVLPGYLASAAAVLDEIQLPAEMRTTVRNYFDGLAQR